MEAINEFLSQNAAIITAILSAIIAVLGFVAFKWRDVVIVAATEIKLALENDGKIDNDELKTIINKVLAAMVAKIKL